MVNFKFYLRIFLHFMLDTLPANNSYLNYVTIRAVVSFKHYIAVYQTALGWLFTSPSGSSAKYCNQRVCLSVCLTVHLHISKTTHPNFAKFSLHFTCDHGSVLL